MLCATGPYAPVGRDPLIDIAVALEAAARKDPYFVVGSVRDTRYSHRECG